MSKVDKEIIQKSIRRVLIDFGELSLSETARLNVHSHHHNAQMPVEY